MIPYSKKVLQHFTNPKYFGKFENPDARGEVGNLRCGDIMVIYLKIQKSKGKNRMKDKIKDIRFETLGCAAALATSDMICELVKGKTLEGALKVGFSDVAKNLGQLPPVKMHCAVLATDGLKAAIENYKSRNL